VSLLVSLNTNPEFEPERGTPRPDRLVSGNPLFKTWLLDSSRDGAIETGIWEATPGETRAIRAEMYEFCHILSGIVEVVEQNGATLRYGAGDSFVIKPGFVGIWRTVETVRKIFVICP